MYAKPCQCIYALSRKELILRSVSKLPFVLQIWENQHLGKHLIIRIGNQLQFYDR